MGIWVYDLATLAKCYEEGEKVLRGILGKKFPDFD
jgi:hypothetical protein